MTPQDAATRVARGAALLDNTRPLWWRNDIRPEALDLSCGETCIIGQIFKDTYHHGLVLRQPHTSDKSAIQFNVDHGFFVRDEDFRDYSVLQEAGLTLIHDRLNEPPIVQWCHRIAEPV